MAIPCTFNYQPKYTPAQQKEIYEQAMESYQRDKALCDANQARYDAMTQEEQHEFDRQSWSTSKECGYGVDYSFGK